ncbi:MAG: tetratricopeptide repeat protein, partial [bacterium]
GFHVWSETYDRQLMDIFAIQDEIAHAIANALQVKLGAEHSDGPVKPETTDLEAYDDYLKGMSLWQARGADNIFEAERLFRAAIARDPQFAKAWAGLALTYVLFPEWTQEPIISSWLQARDAAEHAISLDPNLPEPYAALGYIAMGEFRFATGRALFARAIAIAPSYATAHQWLGEGLLYEGDREGALESTRQATQLDRKSAITRMAHANQLWQLEREDEAAEACRSALAEQPGFITCLVMLHSVAILRGDYATARSVLRQLAESRGAESVRFVDQMVDALEGKIESAEIAAQLAGMPDGVTDLQALSPLADYDAAFWLVQSGHLELAMQRVRALQQKLPFWARGMMFDPHMAALNCLPEFQAMAKQYQVADEHVAAMCKRSGG